MNPEEIKKGEFVNLKLLVIENFCHRLTLEAPSGKKLIVWLEDFEALSPANGKKNAEPAPKYDPNSKFRAGDIVEPCQVKGRWLSEAWKDRAGIHYKVALDEDDDCVMWVLDPDSHHRKCVAAVFFQLVTPAEELEPYIKLENVSSNSIEVRDKRTNKVEATFYFGKDHAYTFVQAATLAEAERDRLNAEWKSAQNAEYLAQNAELRKGGN